MPDIEASEDNKRITQRQRVLKQGKIILPNGKTIFDCAVRDLSATGAKLLCRNPETLPDTFSLVLPADRSMRDVKVVWRKPDQIGVHFTSPAKKGPLLRW